jgi:hypothetical protein
MVPVCRWGTHKIKSTKNYFYSKTQVAIALPASSHIAQWSKASFWFDPWWNLLHIFSKFFFSLTLRRFCYSARKTAKLRPLKIIQTNLKMAWGLIKPTAYGGFMMLVLLSRIEDIYILYPTNLHQNAVKNYLKSSEI